MQRTKIEWVKNPDGSQGYSWNPIKGICPVGCWYCYARKIYKRFKLDEQIWLDVASLHEPFKKRNPCGIFVCSTVELFHPTTEEKTCYNYRIPHSFARRRDLVFDVIKKNPQHRFYILTKLPQNIDRPMPDNVWLGVTITGDNLRSGFNKIRDLEDVQAKTKFISYEPLLGLPAVGLFDWIIIGRLTQHGHKYDPERVWIEKIVRITQEENIPLFLKDNLKEIYGAPLTQEFPK